MCDSYVYLHYKCDMLPLWYIIKSSEIVCHSHQHNPPPSHSIANTKPLIETFKRSPSVPLIARPNQETSPREGSRPTRSQKAPKRADKNISDIPLSDFFSELPPMISFHYCFIYSWISKAGLIYNTFNLVKKRMFSHVASKLWPWNIWRICWLFFLWEGGFGSSLTCLHEDMKNDQINL